METKIKEFPLDFQTLPDSHSWNRPPTEEDSLPVCDESHVPVIDLAGPRAIELIRSACEKWGVFRVINHGIPLDLLDQADSQTMKLFSLPADRKIKAARAPSSHGSTGYGEHTVSALFPKQMWYESYSILGDGSPLMEHAIKVWPHHEDDLFLGDLVHILTNGRFKNILHRVLVDKDKSRASRAYFYRPPKEVKISPASKMVDDSHPTIYKAVSWDDVLSAKAKYLDKALESINI
ncbi:gibberellin 3-beta-dioxygenase 1-like [Rutidosis leptorrhynchoides]|uniref:gibberellin 3-beta-dioxygenase 1-like n=1 Tax=Rutidosis leptorrhynchoides TaxID=125765 RepID=UPI003A9948F6